MPHILVVDDEPGVQESLRMLLKSEAEIHIAGDAEAALREVTLQTPDLVLLDLQMPKRCGLSAAKELRSLSSSASARIVAVTADVFNSLRLAEEETPFDAIVTKPFSLGDIREQVLAAAASLR